MVDLSFISTRFLGADNADKAFAPPCEHDPIDICIDPAKGNEANLSVVLAVVDPLQNFVGKDFPSGQERDSMFGEVGSGLLFVPLEFKFQGSPILYNIHKCVHETHSSTALADKFKRISTRYIW